MENINARNKFHMKENHLGRRLFIPYRVLAMLLYGEFDWLDRELPLIVVPTTAACKQLRTTPQHLEEAFDWLHNSGIIKKYNWQGHYTSIEIQPPIDMGFIIGKDIEWIQS